jgi:hypothetical protein
MCTAQHDDAAAGGNYIRHCLNPEQASLEATNSFSSVQLNTARHCSVAIFFLQNDPVARFVVI